ncbi:acyl-CoA N-acyltransferase [Tanacetum coccineum]
MVWFSCLLLLCSCVLPDITAVQIETCRHLVLFINVAVMESGVSSFGVSGQLNFLDSTSLHNVASKVEQPSDTEVLGHLCYHMMSAGLCGYMATVTNLKDSLEHWLCGSAPITVTLEAEITIKGALALYGQLGFIRAKRLFRYYLNVADAFRLKLLFPHPELPSYDHSFCENLMPLVPESYEG